jgi:phage/plasmid-like protein (TIGR03299 family)
MTVINFQDRLRQTAPVISNAEAEQIRQVQEIIRETKRREEISIRLPWTGSIKSVTAQNQKNVSLAMHGSTANFDVYLDRLMTHDGIRVAHKVVRRSDNHSVLGVVGKNYTPLQNSKAFDWFQPILDNSDTVLTNAGSLFGGRKTTIIAKLPGSTMEIAKGDIVDSYLKLTNSHDGKGSLKLEFLPMRLVCMNGLAACKDGSMLLKTRHTAKIGMRLDNVSDIIRKISDDYREVATVFQDLAAKPVKSELEFKMYVQQVLQCQADSKMIDQCLVNFQAGRGASLAGSTWWGAYNAVNEFLQWQANDDQQKGIESLLYGRNEHKNRRALQLAIAA